MTDNPALEPLRAIRGGIAEIRLDVRDLEQRMTDVGIAVTRFSATETDHDGNQRPRVDRLDARVDRIHRRLEFA